jgi:hypothetical protein
MTATDLRNLAAGDVRRARWHLAEAAKLFGETHQTLAHPDVPEDTANAIGWRCEALQRMLIALNEAAAIDQAALTAPPVEGLS